MSRHEDYLQQESKLRGLAQDYRERAERCADEGSAVGTREWLDAAEKALASAERIARIRRGSAG